MPVLRAGEWVYEQGELPAVAKDPETRAEDKAGHRPLSSYSLPKWCYHTDRPQQKVIIEKSAYFGMAADGLRNWENWNVAHVAAFHDDLKLLSLATLEQCKEPNRWGMTPTHMTGMGQHPYGPSLAVLYELVQLGVADPEAVNHANQTPWHICQRMHKPQNLKKFEKVLLKGQKPDHYDIWKEAFLRPRGKFARSTPIDVVFPDPSGPLPVCIVFPGQGSQYVGMLDKLRDIPAVVQMCKQAQGILGYDIVEVIENGPEEKLLQPKFCQPAMYIAALAAIEKLRLDDPSKVNRCLGVAGLSLGEFAACNVAGVFDFETGLKLVQARAEAMDFQATKPGVERQAMLSVAGLDQEVVERLCRECAKGQICQISNHLFPKGFTVGGVEAAIKAMEQKAKEAGALQAKILRTSGAFHTPMMKDAKGHFLTELRKVKEKFKVPRCKIYMNATATALQPGADIDDIIKGLSDQLASPVLWQQSMEQAIKDGCAEFIECGPSKQLKSMMKRIDPVVAETMLNVPE